MEVLLEASNLAKAYGARRAVDGVSFQVRAGQTLGLIGPNGAGNGACHRRPRCGSHWPAHPSYLGFAGIALCFALVTASFGVLIAAFGKTPEAARGLALFATLMMVMLGGAWLPSFLFPAWLQQAALAVPTKWAIDGLDAVTWRGMDVAAALPAMGAQLGFALLFAALAVWRFRKMEG